MKRIRRPGLESERPNSVAYIYGGHRGVVLEHVRFSAVADGRDRENAAWDGDIVAMATVVLVDGAPMMPTRHGLNEMPRAAQNRRVVVRLGRRSCRRK